MAKKNRHGEGDEEGRKAPHHPKPRHTKPEHPKPKPAHDSDDDWLTQNVEDPPITYKDLEDIRKEVRAHDEREARKKRRDTLIGRLVVSTAIGIGSLLSYQAVGLLRQRTPSRDEIVDKALKDVSASFRQDTNALLAKTLESNSHIAFADCDHTSEEIPLFIGAKLKTLKACGVDAIFLEMDRGDNVDEALANNTYSYQVIKSHHYLNLLAKENGIKVFFMDKPFITEAAKRGAELHFACQRARKLHGEDSIENQQALALCHGPDWEVFRKERREVNADWVAYLSEMKKKHKLNKTVSLSGNAHFYDDDFDERLDNSDVGRSARIDLVPHKVSELLTLDLSILKKKNEAEHMLLLPEHPDDLKEHLTFPVYKDLVDTGRWEDVQNDPGTYYELPRSEQIIVLKQTLREGFEAYSKYPGFDEATRKQIAGFTAQCKKALHAFEHDEDAQAISILKELDAAIRKANIPNYYPMGVNARNLMHESNRQALFKKGNFTLARLSDSLWDHNDWTGPSHGSFKPITKQDEYYAAMHERRYEAYNHLCDAVWEDRTGDMLPCLEALEKLNRELADKALADGKRDVHAYHYSKLSDPARHSFRHELRNYVEQHSRQAGGPSR